MKDGLGVRIKTMRQSRSMTQTDLAHALQVSRSAVGMWESGEREPNLDTIEALADIFNVPMLALIEEKPAAEDGLSDDMRELIHFVKKVPDDKAALVLRVMKSILADDQ